MGFKEVDISTSSAPTGKQKETEQYGHIAPASSTSLMAGAAALGISNLTSTNDLRKVYSIFSLVQELVNKNYSDLQIADYINQLIRKHNIDVDFQFSSNDIKIIKIMLKTNQLSLRLALQNLQFKPVFAKIHILAVQATKESLPQKDAQYKIQLLQNWLIQQAKDIIKDMLEMAVNAALLDENIKNTALDSLKKIDDTIQIAINSNQLTFALNETKEQTEIFISFIDYLVKFGQEFVSNINESLRNNQYLSTQETENLATLTVGLALACAQIEAKKSNEELKESIAQFLSEKKDWIKIMKK